MIRLNLLTILYYKQLFNLQNHDFIWINDGHKPVLYELSRETPSIDIPSSVYLSLKIIRSILRTGLLAAVFVGCGEVLMDFFSMFFLFLKHWRNRKERFLEFQIFVIFSIRTSNVLEAAILCRGFQFSPSVSIFFRKKLLMVLELLHQYQ